MQDPDLTAPGKIGIGFGAINAAVYPSDETTSTWRIRSMTVKEYTDEGIDAAHFLNGNVGIGTTAPSEILDVVGNAKATTFISNQATGTAPLTVASTTAVTNLNADLLDGNHASDFYLATNPSGYQTAAQVSSTVAALVDSAPGTLDTLNELAAALGDDANFASTVTTALAGKAATSHTHTYADLTGTVPTWNQSTTGSAATLTTARTLTIGSTGKTFNGGANVSWTLAEIGAAATTHTHPISSITNLQSALDSAATLASPAFTGTPTAPTATAGTNTTQIATTAFVSTAVANLINSAPGALDTLDELAAALGDDANFASTVTTALAGKANDNAVVKLTDNQTISGQKAFSDPVFINNSLNSDGGTIQVNVDSFNVDGSISADGTMQAIRFISTQATGTAPLTVASTTAVTNLNADLLDGSHASAFALTGHTHGNILNNGTITAAAVTIESGDTLLIANNNNSQLIERGIAFGTATTTFLRNDGTWNSPTGTITGGGIAFGNQGGTGLSYSSAGAQNSILRATNYNGVHWAPSWQAPADDAANGALSTSSTSITTERNVAFGLVRVNNADQTRANTIYAPTAGGTANYSLFGNGTTSAPIWDRPHTTLVTGTAMTNNTYITAFTFTNYRYIKVQMFLTGTNTTKRNELLIDTQDTKQLSASNSGTTFWRMMWNDGTNSWADTVTIQRVSATTMNFKILSGQNFTCRVTGFRGAA
jgi:hypothetical protein